ncbi:MAG TPA: signal peptide peptidase SppA [Kofleriaceae bacterium]|nr:signal peptide peptidase SppA [Kofleriaceae bacterium]
MRIGVSLVAIVVTGGLAHAQAVDRRYAEEPTRGLALPTTGITGEHDARAVVSNAGGLPLLRGPEMTLALDLEDPDQATSAGPGFGAYFASGFGGGILPRLGFGMGFEWLRPSRAQVTPDPGDSFRYTMGMALGLGPKAGFGLAWHHWSADGNLDAEDTFDLGLSSRWGSHLAIGATLLDINTKPIGGTPVQRRYELEALMRPLATDTLEVGIGGRIGETRGDLDGWLRLSARLVRGVYLLGEAESRKTYALESSPMTGLTEDDGRELRLTAGLEFSFGSFGVTALGSGLRNDLGENHPLGSTLIIRASELGPASVLGHGEHIERVELSGTIGSRDLTAIVLRLRAIAKDSTAKALIVMFDGADGGWATLQELRDEILAVKKTGKKVFAYMVSGTGRDYFVASAADKIYVDPAGGVRIVGMAGSTLHFRGTFDLIGVTPQFEKIAEYKSAPEQFTETKATDTAAKMMNDLYDSLWDQWLTAVADGRHLSKDDVKALVDAGPYTAGDLAKDKKLVDAVASPDKIAQLIVAEIGHSYPVTTGPSIDRPERWTRPGIAIIYVEGDITDGKSQTVPLLGRSVAGGETLVAAVTAARNDPRVGAIVLRIDSPGGSALASELVSREIFQTRGVKPVICSFSDLAASGGYFIAAGCDAIYAEPMTITGSIGIFYGKFDLSGLMGKLGVTMDTYKRGKRSDVESLFRPYTDEERTTLLEKLKYMYSRFVGAVAEGRKLTKEQVDGLGRGHVYTGTMAKPIQLVDKLGGLGDALDDAKHRMKLDPSTHVTIYELPKPAGSLLGPLGSLIGARADTSAPSVYDLPVVRSLLDGFPASLLVSPESAQARLPYDILIQ